MPSYVEAYGHVAKLVALPGWDKIVPRPQTVCVLAANTHNIGQLFRIRSLFPIGVNLQFHELANGLHGHPSTKAEPVLRQQSVVRGAVYTTLAMTSVAVMAAVVKWASFGFSSELLMVVRWGAGLVVFGVYRVLSGHVCLRTAKWRTQSMVGISWTLSVFVYYVSLRTLPLMDATLLLNTSALFSPLLAVVFAGKRERWTVWVGVLIGFVGVVAVLRPGSAVFQPMSLVGLLSGLLMELRVFLNSQLGDEPKQRTTFYSLAVGLVVCLMLFAAEGFQVAPPDWQGMLFTPRQIA